MAAGHTFDTTFYANPSLGNPQTTNYTCGAGTTVLFLGIRVRDSVEAESRAGGAPTYNGVAFTDSGLGVIKDPTIAETSIEVFYMLAPPTGSALLVSIPNTGQATLSGIAYTLASFKANSGTSAFDSSNSAATSGTASTSTSTNAVTNHDGCVIFGLIGDGAQTWAPSARTGTQLDDHDEGSAGGGAQYFLQSTAGTQSVGWTFGTAEDWGIIWVAVYDAVVADTSLRLTTPNMKIGSRLKPHAFSPGNTR